MKEISFYEKVYAVVRMIPLGRVTTYGAIAKYLGTAQSSRLVGWGMNNAHGILPEIPAHRVVNRIGMLSGKAHFSSPNRMQALLKSEGVLVIDDQVQNFEQIFWDPSLALNLV